MELRKSASGVGRRAVAVESYVKINHDYYQPGASWSATDIKVGCAVFVTRTGRTPVGVVRAAISV